MNIIYLYIYGIIDDMHVLDYMRPGNQVYEIRLQTHSNNSKAQDRRKLVVHNHHTDLQWLRCTLISLHALVHAIAAKENMFYKSGPKAQKIVVLLKDVVSLSIYTIYTYHISILVRQIMLVNFSDYFLTSNLEDLQ